MGRKAKSKLLKHGISFERATTTFRDPSLLSIPDGEHSEFEERWITIGLDRNGIMLVISHKFINSSAAVCEIRIISARKATKTEEEQYEEGI